MVDPTLLLRRMATIRHCLERLETRQELSREQFLADPDAQDIVLRNLQVGVQAALDIALHIIRDEGWTMPGSSTGSFELLAQRGVIDFDLASRLRQAGQMRNLLVHVYDAIDLGKVYDVYQNHREDLTLFSRAVLEYFELG